MKSSCQIIIIVLSLFLGHIGNSASVPLKVDLEFIFKSGNFTERLKITTLTSHLEAISVSGDRFTVRATPVITYDNNIFFHCIIERDGQIYMSPSMVGPFDEEMTMELEMAGGFMSLKTRASRK